MPTLKHLPTPLLTAKHESRGTCAKDVMVPPSSTVDHDQAIQNRLLYFASTSLFTYSVELVFLDVSISIAVVAVWTAGTCVCDALTIKIGTVTGKNIQNSFLRAHRTLRDAAEVW